MKIIRIVTHPAEIRRILSNIGWPTVAPEFDPPYELIDWNICQLIPGTADGFPDVYETCYSEEGPDPPQSDLIQVESYIDPLHWDDSNYITYD